MSDNNREIISAIDNGRGQAEEETQKAKEELEQRVAERTAELQVAIQSLEELIYQRTLELDSACAKLEKEATGRRQAEEALREIEKRYRIISENTGDVIWILDINTQHYTFVSPSIYRLRGYTPQEMMAKTMEQSLTPEIYQYVSSFLSPRIAAFADGDESMRMRTDQVDLLRKDGSIVSTEVVTTILCNQEGKPELILGITRDITDRKRAEQALQAKQEELTAANEELQVQSEELTAAYEELHAQSEALTDSFIELQRQAEETREYAEAATRARDEAQRRAAELDVTISSIGAGVIIYDNSGKVIRINEFARNLLEYYREDDHAPDQDRNVFLNLRKSDGTLYENEETPLYRALRGEIIRDEEMIISRESDQSVWISGTLAPIYDYHKNLCGATFIFTDITERKRKVEDLLASERELLKVTLNSLGEGVVASDQEERIIFINETAARLTGYSQDEAIGEPLSKIFYVIDDLTSEPMVITAYQKVLSNPILVTRDLREVPIEIESSPIKVTDGRISGTVTVLQDISEKQKIEQELLKTEKLESLGILAGGIAHDFNNILSAILSNIQLAILKLEKNEDIRKYLSNTVETARKASDLTKQLLTFSKGGVPVKKDASLIELIKDTAEFVLRGANTKAEFTIPDDLWAASVDEGQISQVIHNLVINAKQAMPRGGIINISAENRVMGTDTRLNSGKYVKITVQDRGVGISKENIPKIFDPFFTTKKDGNGLGLTTSYSIIKQHNGYIDVESREGIGTTFFLYLPASDVGVIKTDFQKEVAITRTGLKILLMDDEETILNAVGEMLEFYGYRVILTTDGVEAIEQYKHAKVLGEPFDAMIMDLTVPGGMGGQEAIAHLRDFDPKVKAIVSSGYANDPIMSDYERYGFVGVVSKPYKIDELNEVLQRVIN